MRPTILIAAALFAVPAPCLAAKFEMAVTAGVNQNARMQDGIAAVDSYGSTSTTRLVPPDDGIKKRSSIQILVMNQGDAPFNLGPENVRAHLSDGTAVLIIGYDQLVKEEKRRRVWSAIAAGLAAGANSFNASTAGYSSGTTSFRGSSYGTVGRTPYNSTTYGTATYSGYDATAAQLAEATAQQQNQATFDRMAAQNASRMGALSANMRTTTVDPGQMFGGAVMFELPAAARKSKVDVPVTFIVTAGGEEHRFEAVLKRR